MAARKNFKETFYTMGRLNGEDVRLAKSTMARQSGMSVHMIDKLIAEGNEGQDLIDIVYTDQLKIQRIRNTFLYKRP